MEEFPTEDDFEELYASDFALSAINYKHYSDSFGLSGIQLVFSNGITTPLFESKAAEFDELKTVKINPLRTVCYISWRFNGVAYEGLRLYDESNSYVLNLTWHKAPTGEWSKLQEIPVGQQIIGLKCNLFDESIGVIFYLEFVKGPVPNNSEV